MGRGKGEILRGWNKVQWWIWWTHSGGGGERSDTEVELDFAHVRFYRKFSFHVINCSILFYYFFSNFSSAIVWEGVGGIRGVRGGEGCARVKKREEREKRFVFVYLCETRIKKKKRQKGIRLKESEMRDLTLLKIG